MPGGARAGPAAGASGAGRGSRRLCVDTAAVLVIVSDKYVECKHDESDRNSDRNRSDAVSLTIFNSSNCEPPFDS